MNSANSPYDAPAADLSNPNGNAGAYQPTFFSISGRIGRARYVAYFMGTIVLVFLVIAALATLMTLAGKAGSVMMTFMPLLMAVVLMAANIVLVIRRVNDMNRTGWLAVLALVPFVTFVFALWLLFAPGDKDANKYGAPPCRNGAGVIAACCVAVLVVLFSAAAAFGAYKMAQLGILGNSSRWSEHNPQ